MRFLIMLALVVILAGCVPSGDPVYSTPVPVLVTPV